MTLEQQKLYKQIWCIVGHQKRQIFNHIKQFILFQNLKNNLYHNFHFTDVIANQLLGSVGESHAKQFVLSM